MLVVALARFVNVVVGLFFWIDVFSWVDCFQLFYFDFLNYFFVFAGLLGARGVRAPLLR